MVFIERRFKIGCSPGQAKIILEKLKEYNCIPYQRYEKFNVLGKVVPRIYFEDALDPEKLDEFIKWLNDNEHICATLIL